MASPARTAALGAFGIAIATLAISFGCYPSHYDLVDGSLLAFSALLVGTASSCSVGVARTFGRLQGALAATLVAAALATQLREALRSPGTPAMLPGWLSASLTLAALGVGIGIAWWATPPLPRSSRVALARSAALAAVAAVLFVITTYRTVPSFRWHLLQHNRLEGVLLHHLLDRPIEEVEDALWRDHATGAVESAAPAAPFEPTRSGGAAGTAPNLMVVLVDTLRADSLSVLGGDPSWMPRLDRRVGKGVAFLDVLASTSWTRPSVASLFTGLAPEYHGAVDWDYVLPDERLTLAERLRARGYRTAAFVAARHAVNGDAGFAQGFDSFEHLRQEPFPYARAESVVTSVLSWIGHASGAESRASGDSGPPVFLYLHLLDPHAPYLSGGPQNPASDAASRRGYQAELRYLDEQLERLFEEIPRALPGRTLVLLVADHGEELGEHAGHGHGHTLYRELLHVPVALFELGNGTARGKAPATSESTRADESPGPGPHGSTLAAPLELRDFQGLLPALADEPDLALDRWADARARRVRYASIYHSKRSSSGLGHWLRPYRARICMRAVESGGYSLVWSAYGDTVELYDLARDPGQLRNLARTDPERVAELRAELEGAVPAPWAERQTTTVSAEDDARIRALGYVQ